MKADALKFQNIVNDTIIVLVEGGNVDEVFSDSLMQELQEDVEAIVDTDNTLLIRVIGGKCFRVQVTEVELGMRRLAHRHHN